MCQMHHIRSHNTHSSGWHGEMSTVWCPPISGHFLFVCLCFAAWPLHSLVSSSPLTPELVFESRFNLHASCLQEEEVEEFRVSLSCVPDSSCFGLARQKFESSLHPCHHKLCMSRHALYERSCVCLCLFMINPSVCITRTTLKSLIDPLIVYPTDESVCWVI